MEVITYACRVCGAPTAVLAGLASELPAVQCHKCTAREEKAARHKAHLERCTEAFGKCCPPCFPDTEVGKLPCPTLSEYALRWRWGPKGMHLYGVPGSGKTRTLSVLVRRAIFTGHSVCCLGPGTFRQQCEAREWRRGAWLKRLGNVDLLFIDDIDKLSLTKDMEKDLFSVITARAGFKPTYSTSNSDREKIAALFRVTSAAMARRIFDYNFRLRFDQDDFGC